MTKTLWLLAALAMCGNTYADPAACAVRDAQPMMYQKITLKNPDSAKVPPEQQKMVPSIGRQADRQRLTPAPGAPGLQR